MTDEECRAALSYSAWTRKNAIAIQALSWFEELQKLRSRKCPICGWDQSKEPDWEGTNVAEFWRNTPAGKFARLGNTIFFQGTYEVEPIYHRWRWAWKQLMAGKKVTWKDWNSDQLLSICGETLQKKVTKAGWNLYTPTTIEMTESGWTLYEEKP